MRTEGEPQFATNNARFFFFLGEGTVTDLVISLLPTLGERPLSGHDHCTAIYANASKSSTRFSRILQE